MTMRQILGDALFERTVRFSRRNYGCPLNRVIREALNEWLDRHELPLVGGAAGGIGSSAPGNPNVTWLQPGGANVVFADFGSRGLEDRLATTERLMEPNHEVDETR